MNDEYRRPQIIQQELSSLQELIRKNGQLISSYPDDFALKLNLKSLKNREENLLSELINTFKIKPESFQTMSISNDSAKKIYDVIIKEEEIPEKNVDLKGILKAINLFSNTFEFLINESNERIKGTFDENLVLQVKNHFDKVSIALFRLSTQLSEVTDEEKIKWKLLGFKD